MKEIDERRSIRKYTGQEISDSDIRDILASAINAPSAKNRQPWKFIVVQGDAKKEMLNVFRKGMEREEAGDAALLSESKQHIEAAKYTISIMEQAPVIIFVVNAMGKGIFEELSEEERVFELCNIQSISAAIQNMLLEATHKGLGSLWICDIFFAYQELNEWLDVDGELLAALAFGYPDEFPRARPRKRMEDVTIWKK